MVDTVEAIILSQLPIGIGVIAVAFELHKLRKALEKIAKRK